MRHFGKQSLFITLIISLVLVSGYVLPVHAAEYITEEEPSNFVTGYRPIPDDFPTVDDIDYSEARQSLYGDDDESFSDTYLNSLDSAESVPAAYPASYDADWLSILEAKYPGTRSQSPYGSCWAHACIAASEFDLISQGKASSTEDCSELHLVYWSYTNGTPSAVAGDTGDRVSFDTSAGENIMDNGGNTKYAVQTLMRQRGVVKESIVPYSQAAGVLRGNGLAANTERSDSYYLNNAYEINIQNNPDQVKEAIVAHGAVTISYYMDDDSYYNSANNCYYCGLYDWRYGNHAVVVVGWDDDFPAEKFNRRYRPSGNGAWLIRNSWSTNTSASIDSYFWISYEEPSISGAWVLEMSDRFPYDNHYYYDSQIHESYSVYGAKAYSNIYTASGNCESETLEAVGFELANISGSETNYTVKIYKNLTGSDPSSGVLVPEATTTGKILYKGSYTIPLRAPVTLENGSKFAVAVSFDDPEFSIVNEHKLLNFGGLNATFGASPGQSFYTYDGSTWEDCINGEQDIFGNLVISAMTSNPYRDDDLSSITLSPTSMDFTQENQTQTLTAVVSDSKGRIDETAAVTFTSSDPAVASVVGNGQTATVTALSSGNALITAVSGTLSATCSIRVNIETPEEPDPGSNISPLCPIPDLGSDCLYLVKGQKVTLPHSGSGFGISDNRIASVTKAGVLTAKNVGMATVWDYRGDISYSIYVVEPTFSKKNMSIVCGDHVDVSLKIGISRISGISENYGILWRCNTPSVAKIEEIENGCRIYGLSKGTANITAYVNGKAYNTKVAVKDTEPVKLQSEHSSITLSPLQTITLSLKGKNFKNAVWTAEGMDSTGTGNKKVYFNDIVYITSTGKLTAVGSGTTSIYCQSNNVQIDITVREPSERVIYMSPGKTASLKFYGVKNKDAVWDCSDHEGVIDVNNLNKNGSIKSLNAGIATVNCTYSPYPGIGKGFTYTTKVHVENPRLVSDRFELLENSQFSYQLIMHSEDTYTLSFINDERYTVSEPVLFTSSNPTVAYVDEYGVVHAGSVSKNTNVNLTATIAGKKLTVKAIIK